MTEPLVQLLERIDAGLQTASHGDAIDRTLASPARKTAMTPLRDHEVMRRFRRELAAGALRVETVNQALTLLNKAVSLL